MKAISDEVGSNENLIFDDEEREPYPLAEIEKTIEIGDFTEEQAQAMLWQFNLKRTADNLMQAASPEYGPPAQLLGRGHFRMTGFVRDGHFHVFESFGIGLSHRDMLNQSTESRPFALEFIAEKGDTICYLD